MFPNEAVMDRKMFKAVRNTTMPVNHGGVVRSKLLVQFPSKVKFTIVLDSSGACLH